MTNASIIRRKEEASAQSARAKADEAAARARLEAEKSAWKVCSFSWFHPVPSSPCGCLFCSLSVFGQAIFCFFGVVDCVPTKFVGAYEVRARVRLGLTGDSNAVFALGVDLEFLVFALSPRSRVYFFLASASFLRL